MWVFVLYRPVLHAPFVYDDVGAIVENPFLKHLDIAIDHFLKSPTYFTNEFRGQGGTSYRPAFWISLALDNVLWGDKNPGAFHCVNVLMHWCNGVLLFIFLHGLLRSHWTAAIASWLWLSLPINVEVVAWVSARSYLLCAMALLLALYTAMRYIEARRLRCLLLACVSTFAGLASNEAGILIPGLLFTCWLVKDRERQVETSRAWRVLALSITGTIGVFLLLRYTVGGHAAPGPLSLWAAGAIFAKYWVWMSCPLHMSVERSTSLPANAPTVVALGCWAAAASYLAFSFWLTKRQSALAFGLLWVGIALLPYCGFIFLYQGMAERYAYIPSMGVAIAVANLVVIVPSRWRRPVAIVMAGWMLWGIWRIHTRSKEWCDSVTLFETSLRTTPGSPILPRALASVLLSSGTQMEDQGDFAGAERLFRLAIEYAPNEIAPYNDLGTLLFHEGHRDEGLELLEKAISLRPNEPAVYFNMGRLLEEMGQDEMAAKFYVKTLQLNPSDREALAQLRSLHLR